MPNNEHQPTNHDQIEPTLDGEQPQPDSYENNPRHKTLAVRIDEDLHTQLRFIADLAGTSVTDEIRQAIQQRITTTREDPTFLERAEQVRAQIERDAAARSAAIAGFLGTPAVAASTTDAAPPKSTTRGRRPAKASANESILGERS